MVSPSRSRLRHHTWYTALILASILLLLFPQTPAARLALDDDTPPVVGYTVDGTTGTNGWYRGSPGRNYIVVHWTVTDPQSPIISTTGCEPAIQVNGPSTGTTLTCSATSDGGTTAVTTKSLKIDATPPDTTAAPSRAPNGAGWYRTPVSISWSGTDATSGIASCRTPLTYGGPDTIGTAQSGSCTDNAGNSSSDAVVVRYDSTPPATTAASLPAPNANGWLKSPVSVTWSGSDATSRIASCDPSIAYSGPDTSGTDETGGCTDNAGNSSSATFVVRYDTVAPTTVAAPARPPNAAGWYRAPVSIGWSGSDARSGIDSCSVSVTYAGPDTTGGSRSGSCTDNAGNSSSESLVVRYDATAPTGLSATPGRAPDHDGWYNHSLRIDWSGSDATSGIASCSSQTYGGPDGANATATGSCTDAAGNLASAGFPLQYDATGPAVTVSAARSPDNNGWYNHAVAISWSGTDTTSGVDSCTPPTTYSGPDSGNASSGGGCTDRAGNSASPPPLAFKYDATAPVSTAVPSRPPDTNGWYNHGLRIAWPGSDPVSGIASCSSLAYSGPDAASVSLSGACTDRAGNASTPSAFRFRYDATAPGGLGVSPARPPDHDGWYNHPLAIRWSGSDAVAGIALCTSFTYGSATAASGELSGSCTDRAGNRSGPLGFELRYDETPPSFKELVLKARDGLVKLRWRVTGAGTLHVTRSPGRDKASSSDLYTGSGTAFADRRVENYVRYRYTVTASDPAGNIVERSAFARPLPTLFAPRPGARLGIGSAPRLAWRAVRRARYYNVQLWRDGLKVGSWWPSYARLRVPSRWRLDGEQQRLLPGAYSWYVWPGRGAPRLGRYGPLLGKSTFVIG